MDEESTGFSQEEVLLPVRWVGAEETPLLVANQFIGQIAPGEVILNFGAVAPPIIVPGTPEQQAEQLVEHSYVPVKIVARLGVSRMALEQLAGVIQQTLTNYDQAHKMEEPGA